MKHIIILTSFLLSSTFSFAQNLVPNFSFEEADSCPTNLNDRTYEYSLGCINWGQATWGGPTYFNACDTAAVSIGKLCPWVGVPSNCIGYQYAYQGVAYMGINMYVDDLPDYKQYLLTNIPALEIDTAYEVTIHVSLADSCEYATDGMGVFFTTYGSPDQSTEGTLIETPQIDYTSYGIITDSINWTTLSGTFIADSAYTTLIIGGFKTSSDMNIIAVNDSPSNSHTNAYYYIDAVVVEKFSATGIASINNNNAVSIFPNPFIDHATLLFNCPYGSSYSFTLRNTEGQIVQQAQNITTSTFIIERNNLPSGFYYYQLRNENNIIANGKLIIK